MSKSSFGIGILLTAFCTSCLVGCNASTTTRGKPSEEGRVEPGKSAERERGGSTADWAQGTGRPGSGRSPTPKKEILRSPVQASFSQY